MRKGIVITLISSLCGAKIECMHFHGYYSRNAPINTFRESISVDLNLEL